MGQIINLILIIICIALGYFLLRKEKQPREESEQIGRLKETLEVEKADKNKLRGELKLLEKESNELKTDKKILENDKEKLQNVISKYKAEEKQKDAKRSTEITDLAAARKNLEDEKNRIRQEDIEKKQQEETERNRIWAEHEEKVKNYLIELCESQEYGFQYYDNTDLPDGFSGKFKPDFIIEFLNQYIIFDAKISKSDNLQIYISNQVKTTAEKINNNPKIYNTVFFVIPTQAINFIKKYIYYEKGYTFFVISPESLAAILAAYKKISQYEFAEQINPQERENIINLIADFDYHINYRNAADLVLTKQGINILGKASRLPQELIKDIAIKKEQIRTPVLPPSELRELLLNTKNQDEEIYRLVAPKAKVAQNIVKTAIASLGGSKGSNKNRLSQRVIGAAAGQISRKEQ